MPTPEQINRWKKEGHWPPPQGITFVEEKPVDPNAVVGLMHQLKNVLPPKQQKVIDEVIAKISAN